MPVTNINSISADQVQTSGTPEVSSRLNLPKETRVAIIFHRFGPYHHARLNAAGRLMSVWGMEACAMDGTYAWDKVEGAAAFTRLTLTDRDSGGRKWRQELQRKMWQTLDEIKPHVVVVPGWSLVDALIALSWCAKNKTPSVVMTESTEWDERRVESKEWIKSRLVRLNSAALAGGTPHREYLHQLGFPRERVFLGYDVVDNDYFVTRANGGRKQQVENRKRFGLPEKYFLASARFVKKKNLPRLLQAYAQYRDLAKESDVWDLVLLGDGPLRSTIFDLRSSLGLESSVHLPGFKQYDELPVYFGLASAFIHASTTEQWGLVVNEAMASGLPVLVSHRCGCADDLVLPGVNGFQFDPNNMDEMARLMLKLSTKDFPLSAFGASSVQTISNWGPRRFADGFQAAVETAIRVGPHSFNLMDEAVLNGVLRCKLQYKI